MKCGLLLPVLLALACIALPPLGALICAAMLALQLCLIAVRIAAGTCLANFGTERNSKVDPVFSVHVATHNEPAAMVLNTLKALALQDWPAAAFEVIVMDNNTSDPALWRPVQTWCADQGPTFTFLHQDGVQGAKAGALNIALDHARDDATHIVTVDADYQVSTDFLRTAHEALSRTGADYVQFPQAYAHSKGSARGVDAELEEYFRSSAEVADGAESVLLTGTLCVISKTALQVCGGWSGKTTTEDAEMGVRLCHAGFSGRYISQVVGTGYLPFSLRDLEKQRHRWASGNLQTLLLHFPIILGAQSRLPMRKQIALLAQLTAWLNVSLLPALILLIGLLVRPSAGPVLTLAAATVILGFGDLALRILLRGLRDRQDAATVIGALASRIALAPVAAIATFETFIGRKFSFNVTDKSAKDDPSGPPVPALHVGLLVAALSSLPAAYVSGPFPLLATLLLMLALPAAALTSFNLQSYRKRVADQNRSA